MRVHVCVPPQSGCGMLGENLPEWYAFNCLGHSDPAECCPVPLCGSMLWAKWRAGCNTTTGSPEGLWLKPYANQGPMFSPVRGQFQRLLGAGAVRGGKSLTPTLAVTSTYTASSLNLSLDHHSRWGSEITLVVVCTQEHFTEGQGCFALWPPVLFELICMEFGWFYWETLKIHVTFQKVDC